MYNLVLFAAAGCEKHNFFGLVPWYKYLKFETTAGGCQITQFNVLPKGGNPSDIPLVLLAVVDDLLRVAGLIAVVFVIYGAVNYATSQGNPDQVSKAQSTVINALIGLVLAMIAVATVTFIGTRLGA